MLVISNAVPALELGYLSIWINGYGYAHEHAHEHEREKKRTFPFNVVLARREDALISGNC